MRSSLMMFFVVCGVVMMSGCPVGGPKDEQKYSVEITGLSFVEPKGDSLNDHDVAVGGAFPPASNISPAVWRDGTAQFLDTDLGIGILYGINNRGAVVGVQLITAPGSFFHFVSGIDGVTPSTRTLRPGELYSVNDSDELIGRFGSNAVLGFVDNDDVFVFEGENSLLDATSANDINDSGDFAGRMFSFAEDRQLAVKWLKGARTPLDSLGGTFSEAYAINNNGLTVGVSTFPTPTKAESHKAVFWRGTEIVQFSSLGGSESTAWDVNNNAEAVGFSENENGESRAVLWSGPGTAGIIDLNDVVDLGDLEPGSLILREAIDINDSGTILCRADQTIGNAVTRVYVLLRRS